MPFIHQQSGLTFEVCPEYKDPPYIRITKGAGEIIIRIGIPGKELPHIDRYESVSREDVDLAFGIVSDYQEKFLNAWERIHKP